MNKVSGSNAQGRLGEMGEHIARVCEGKENELIRVYNHLN